MLIAVSDSDTAETPSEDEPIATSNEIYTLNVYGCHANSMTYLLLYRCGILIHMAFQAGVYVRVLGVCVCGGGV